MFLALSGSTVCRRNGGVGRRVNLMKGATELPDCLTTVSPGLRGGAEGSGRCGPIAQVIASHEIHGIRNGIPGEANPLDSPLAHRPYDANSMAEKVYNKLWMQERHGLTVSERAPVFGCVSRLLPRKGFELLVEVLPEFLDQGAQLVVTGDGKQEILAKLEVLKKRFPVQVGLRPYSEENAVEVFSGADLFLMPSLEEPCGTAQMQAMRYGTVAGGTSDGWPAGYGNALG